MLCFGSDCSLICRIEHQQGVVVTATPRLGMCLGRLARPLWCEQNRNLSIWVASITWKSPKVVACRDAKRREWLIGCVAAYLSQVVLVPSKLVIRPSTHLRNLQTFPLVSHAGRQDNHQNRNNVQHITSRQNKIRGERSRATDAQILVISSKSQHSGMCCKLMNKRPIVCSHTQTDLSEKRWILYYESSNKTNSCPREN